ncbi:MAG: DUF3093 domain-containing protein [Aeromicrobium sp.]|uniref:DUF3093 domain-containing protein n=1 Tax=Aeromicrobium sp. TaxID=1871063 RepID=UPI0039E414C7
MGYRERLTAPVSWWIGAIGFALTCGWLVYVATTPAIALVTIALAAAAAFTLVWSYGAIGVGVDGELRAGPAHLEPEYIGAVEVLDPRAYRDALGPRADVRAWIATRPWIETGVKVTVADDRDPHPYWLVGTRRPERLAEAIEAVRQTGLRTASGDRTHEKGA